METDRRAFLKETLNGGGIRMTIPPSRPAELSEEAKLLAEKYHRVAETLDGFDVILDVLLTLHWRGTLVNDSQVALHNAAEEIAAKFGALSRGADWQDSSMRAQLHGALTIGERRPSVASDYPERPTDGGI